MNFKISTNYLDGKSNLTNTKSIPNPNSKIDINFFKEHFLEFYGVPKELTKKNLKDQEITEWKFKDKPKELMENWKEIYTYDSDGKLIEYKYSGCTICSQIPWGYKLLYNKNNDIVEQQIYYLEQKVYAEEVGLKVKYELKDAMDKNIMLTYDNNRNIVKLEKIGKDGLEELIELVK
uniref:hypothetical protein n=1 Tax=Zhouia sp. PK063 TaxID=3373602 RepID=UPI0037DDD574